jgi:hypothetical protein
MGKIYENGICYASRERQSTAMTMSYLRMYTGYTVQLAGMRKCQYHVNHFQ